MRARSSFGIVGLETSLQLMLQNLGATGKMSWSRLVEVMAVNPRRLLRLDPVCVKAGSAADLTLIDPAKSATVTPEWMQSRSKNSAWRATTHRRRHRRLRFRQAHARRRRRHAAALGNSDDPHVQGA